MALLVKLSIGTPVRMSVYLGFDHRKAYEVDRRMKWTSTHTAGLLPCASPSFGFAMVQWARFSYVGAYTALMDRRHACAT